VGDRGGGKEEELTAMFLLQLLLEVRHVRVISLREMGLVQTFLRLVLACSAQEVLNGATYNAVKLMDPGKVGQIVPIVKSDTLFLSS
jgi:hypothetical protein